MPEKLPEKEGEEGVVRGREGRGRGGGGEREGVGAEISYTGEIAWKGGG